MRTIFFVLVLSTFSVAQTAATSDSRLAELASKIEQQQKQIEALQKSQVELLEQLKALNPPGSAGTVGQPEATASAAQSAGEPQSQPMQSQAPGAGLPSNTRAAQYTDWRHNGEALKLGDKVKVGGYGSFRFEANDVAPGNYIPGGSAAGFTFRRFVTTLDAKPANRLRVYSEIEYERLHEIEVEKSANFAGGELQFKQATEGRGELAIEQAWGQFNFAENHGLRGGVVLAPVGRFNLLHDDDYWDIPRRTLVDRDAPVLPVKSAWRDLGAGFVGTFNVGSKGKLDYQVYALNGAALDFNVENEAEFAAGAPGEANGVLASDLSLSSGFFDGSKGTSAVAWRVAYSPTLAGEFAFSGYRGNYAPTWAAFHEPVTTLAYDHKWRWKGFETEGEFVYTTLGSLDRTINSLATQIFNSANEQIANSGGGGLTKLEVESELSNLAKTKYGLWSDFKYHARPQWLRNSFLGKPFEDPQIIPILRYERVWLNNAVSDIEITGGAVTNLFRQYLEQDRVTLGASYRPTLQFAIQAAYEHNRRLSGDRLIYPQVEQKSTNGLIVGMSFAF
jgi:hypothetical protein